MGRISVAEAPDATEAPALRRTMALMRSRGVPPANAWRAFVLPGDRDDERDDVPTSRWSWLIIAAGTVVAAALFVAWVVLGNR